MLQCDVEEKEGDGAGLVLIDEAEEAEEEVGCQVLQLKQPHLKIAQIQ